MSFVRCYHVSDTFKDTVANGGTLAGRPLLQWLEIVGLLADDVWDGSIAESQRSLWDAKVFPAVDMAQGYRDWLWMYDPTQASGQQKQAYLKVERFSIAEIALLADMELFYVRRQVAFSRVRVRRGLSASQANAAKLSSHPTAPFATPGEHLASLPSRRA